MVQAEIETLLNSIEAEDDAALAARLQDVDRRLDEAFAQLAIVDTIATAIQESPERAMSIPILRRDLDTLGEDVAADIQTIRAEVDRIPQRPICPVRTGNLSQVDFMQYTDFIQFLWRRWQTNSNQSQLGQAGCPL
ncbi:MAG: hypothetical protein QNJ03_07025 [Dinoroseobacter sp.]|nr:hypothetical protein [Dinoroseobacter sp.]